MRDYIAKIHNNSVGTKKSICVKVSRAIIYDTFIFYLNNLYNLNFIKYYVVLISMINTICTTMWPNEVGYEPADPTVHPPPSELPRVGAFFSYRCLVFPKICPQRNACNFRDY